MKGRTPTGGLAALVLITAVELVVSLDATVVNIALPRIGAGLGLDEAGLSWVINAYLLAFGGCMLAGGRAADLLGPRRVFVAGLALFTIASAVAGFAGTGGVLVVARAAQGIGAAVIIPAQLALLARTFTEPAARRRAFGVWGAMGAAGAAIGTAAGGLLAQGMGWRSIFLINLPIGVAALAGVGRLLPADPARPAMSAGRLDLPGALLGTSGLLLLGYALGALADPAARPTAAVLLVVALAVLATFVAVEARAARPLLPLRLFRVRAVTGSSVVSALVGAAHVPAFVLLALYLQNVQHYSPIQSGFAVMPVAIVGLVVGRMVLPQAMKRFGARTVLAAGLGLQAVALVWFAALPADLVYATDLLPPALIFGLGLPAAFVGVTVPAVTAVDDGDTGVTAGIINTTQRVGSGLGVTAVLLLVEATARGSGPAAYLGGLHAGFVVSAALAALGGLLAVMLPRAAPPSEAPLWAAREGARSGSAAAVDE